MVCIAAFIILCIVGIFVAFISIFRRDIGRRYLKVFKQSMACVGKKATFQKCETGFKENVKNGLLARILLKNPKLLKPASIIIEILAVLVVVITIWSIVEVIKAGLALWTLGTCNVEHPASCALSTSEVCSIDASEPQNLGEHIGRWFSDWGEIFSAIPDKFRSWDASNFDFHGILVADGSATAENSLAIDIMDPGCTVCAASFKNQLNSDFFDIHRVLLVPYVIRDSGGTTKFKNSELIVRYVLAIEQYGAPMAQNPQEIVSAAIGGGISDQPGATRSSHYPYYILKRIFTEQQSPGVDYQSYFNYTASPSAARSLLEKWLQEFGYSDSEITTIAAIAESEEITTILDHNHDLVINNIHAKGIPTMLYDGGKHSGKYESPAPAE